MSFMNDKQSWSSRLVRDKTTSRILKRQESQARGETALADEAPVVKVAEQPRPSAVFDSGSERCGWRDVQQAHCGANPRATAAQMAGGAADK